jgi:F0F1-type ATP synthase assembly protein I
MGGLVSVGQSHRQNSDAALGRASTLEQRNKRTEKRMEQKQKAAESQQQTSAVATGATIGTQISPGWGTVIGAGVGLLASEVF